MNESPTTPELIENALLNAHRKLCAYIGFCKDDKELVKIIEMVSSALLKMPELGQVYKEAKRDYEREMTTNCMEAIHGSGF